MTSLDRLEKNWVYGGFLAGIMLLALSPLLLGGWDRGAILAFLALPVYMLHQFEEHDDDRFHRFVIETFGRGRDVLPTPAIFIINIGAVWALMTVTFWLMRRVDPAFAVVAGYALVVNGLVHVAAFVALRRYNPGLATGVVLFLPLGVAILAAAPAGFAAHLGALAFVVAIHAAIVVRAKTSFARAPVFLDNTASNGG